MKNKIIKILAKDRAETIKLFRISVYLIALIEIVLKIPNLKLFYGSPDKVIETSVVYGLTYIFNIGNIVDLSQFYLLFCHGYIAVLLLNLSRFQNVFTRIMAWYLCGSLNYINPSVGDGGSAVILIFLFFLIFVSEKRDLYSSCRNNVVLFLIRTQMCFIYLSAGLTKVTGQLWTKGVATYYALQVDQFSLPIIQETIAKNELFITASTYGTLMFQLSFPYLIWNKKTRPYVIGFGTLIHLQISLVMGLITFGLIMSVGYIGFYSNKKSKNTLSLFDFSKLTVYFDDECKVCMKIASILKKLDWLNLIDIRYVDGNVNYKQTLNSNSNAYFYKGFSSIVQICKRVPILLVSLPLMQILLKLKIGNYIYDNIILKSKWRNKCSNGVCSL